MSDKCAWKKVRLGDVVHQLKDCVNAESCGLEYYLGGEHFSTDDLHTNGRGEIVGSTIGPAFTMRFKPGHVLIVSRNPHLRKMAVANFEGICSNVTYVCETKSDDLLQDFLPFIIRSSDFWRFAEANKRGSTNFYLNWSDFAQYEFLLPPVEEQKHIAEILWAADEVFEAYKKVQIDIQQLRTAFINDWIGSYSDSFYRFADLWTSSPESGCSASEVARETGHYVLSLSAITINGYQRGERKKVELSSKMKKAVLSYGDLLISRSNTMELVGLSAIYNENTQNVSFPDTMMRISIDESKVLKEYIVTLFNAAYGRHWMKKICAGTSHSMKKINRKSLGEITIPIVSLDQQKSLINKCEGFNLALVNCKHEIIDAQNMLFALINHYLGGAN